MYGGPDQENQWNPASDLRDFKPKMCACLREKERKTNDWSALEIQQQVFQI